MKRFTPPLIALAVGGASLIGSHPAQAHDSAATGVLAGLTHPLLGLDHLLMLLAVGAAASLLSSRLLLWAAGGALLGAAASVRGLHWPGAEIGAALAIAALGGLTLVAARGSEPAAGAMGREGLVSRGRLVSPGGPVVAAGVAIHALLHGQEALVNSSSTFWWGGALISSVLVCGGAYTIFRRLPVAVTRAAAGAFLASGGALALASLSLLAGGAAG
jgi:urease accessory protein